MGVVHSKKSGWGNKNYKKREYALQEGGTQRKRSNNYAVRPRLKKESRNAGKADAGQTMKKRLPTHYEHRRLLKMQGKAARAHQWKTTGSGAGAVVGEEEVQK